VTSTKTKMGTYHDGERQDKGRQQYRLLLFVFSTAAIGFSAPWSFRGGDVFVGLELGSELAGK